MWLEIKQCAHFNLTSRNYTLTNMSSVVSTPVQGLPMRGPPGPDLPDFGVYHSGHAFQATGLDFAGPQFVKENSKHEKAYILLLTCATSQAMHLDLVPGYVDRWIFMRI